MIDDGGFEFDAKKWKPVLIDHGGFGAIEYERLLSHVGFKWVPPTPVIVVAVVVVFTGIITCWTLCVGRFKLRLKYC